VAVPVRTGSVRVSPVKTGPAHVSPSYKQSLEKKFIAHGKPPPDFFSAKSRRNIDRAKIFNIFTDAMKDPKSGKVIEFNYITYIRRLENFTSKPSPSLVTQDNTKNFTNTFGIILRLLKEDKNNIIIVRDSSNRDKELTVRNLFPVLTYVTPLISDHNRVALGSVALYKTFNSKLNNFFNIRIVEDSCVDVAIALSKDMSITGLITILNFANGHTIGGGYFNGGSTAQEESLCYSSLTKEYAECALSKVGYYTGEKVSYTYPIGYDDGQTAEARRSYIILPYIPLTRDKNFTRLNLHPTNPPFIDVINAAAPDNRGRLSRITSSDGRNQLDAIRTWFFSHFYSFLHDAYRKNASYPSSLENENNVLILGPWGCGVFIKPLSEDQKKEYTEMVAEMLVKALVYYVQKHNTQSFFKTIVLCDISRSTFLKACRIKLDECGYNLGY
jgi:uncharacterized protein (TIGR02452 family)